MTTPRGPRVIFKDDRDSSVGRGCVLYGAHFRPEMAAIIHAAAEWAPTDAEVIVFSEGHRDIRDTRDLHEECRAFDVSRHYINEAGHFRTLSDAELESWAKQLRRRLGPDYQIIVHGEGSNRHIHIELDPR